MVKIYKVVTRYRNGNQYEYDCAGYYIDRSRAILEAHRHFDRKSKLCTISKIIVQEIEVFADYFDIHEIDWVNE